MRILVVDDERLARGRLLRMLARVPDAKVVGEAENGRTALVEIAKLKPDLILLDVDMPGLDGLALAERPGLPPIIFTTAHVRFAADAFDIEAVDFLVKPIRQERLERALERIRRRAGPAAASPAHQLTVHGAGSVRFVDARQVTAFRALDKYTGFTIDGEELLVRESLDALAERLADLGFIRVHRAAVVRQDAIAELASEGGVLVAKLTDGSSVEISQRQAPELRRLLGLRR
jgi:DNA-binding LytR/AlgR family response regulator